MNLLLSIIFSRLESLESNSEVLNHHQEENKIGCDVCGEMIDDFLYNSHMMSFHEDQVDDSFIIDSIFEQKEKEIEIKLSQDETNLSHAEEGECSICSKKFQLRRSLVRHIKNVHKNKEANHCHVCRKEVDDVKEHYEEFHSYLHYTCLLCHRKFRSKLILDRHKEFNHLLEREFSCDLCGKTFISKTTIARHVLIHEYERARCY